jgi:hypothetical protein
MSNYRNRLERLDYALPSRSHRWIQFDLSKSPNIVQSYTSELYYLPKKNGIRPHYEVGALRTLQKALVLLTFTDHLGIHEHYRLVQDSVQVHILTDKSIWGASISNSACLAVRMKFPSPTNSV